METGVYCIRNLITGYFYIGSASGGFEHRWYRHRWDLEKGKHLNCRLQADWMFYGKPNFRFCVLEKCLPDQCIKREQYYIDVFDPYYNIARVAGSQLGYRHTPETIARISAALKGRRYSPAHRSRISAALIGNKYGLGNKNSLGCHPSPETRAKLSAALRVRPRKPHTLETRAKISASKIGRYPSLDTRAKMSTAQQARFNNGATIKNLNPL